MPQGAACSVVGSDVIGRSELHDLFLGIAVVNAGCSVAEEASLMSLWAAVRELDHRISILYIAEADTQDQGPARIKFNEFVMYRHYPGGWKLGYVLPCR